MRAFFSLEHSGRHQASPSVPTRSFCESILFVRLEALRGSERRVVRIVGTVGLTLDETPQTFVMRLHQSIVELNPTMISPIQLNECSPSVNDFFHSSKSRICSEQARAKKRTDSYMRLLYLFICLFIADTKSIV